MLSWRTHNLLLSMLTGNCNGLGLNHNGPIWTCTCRISTWSPTTTTTIAASGGAWSRPEHRLTMLSASVRSLGRPKMHWVCVVNGSAKRSLPHPGITRLVRLYQAATDNQPSLGVWKNAAPAAVCRCTKLPSKRASMSCALGSQLPGIICTSPAPLSAGWKSVEKYPVSTAIWAINLIWASLSPHLLTTGCEGISFKASAQAAVQKWP